MPNQTAFLNTHLGQIHNQAGHVVTLRGVGLGGWMNMENFITGFPATETDFRRVIRRALGEEKASYFFDRYLDDFFTDEDAAFIRSLGLNTVRLPFNYRHFEDDMAPFELRTDGFKFLDRAIEICARHELYTVLDLHAAPGFQNQDWHSDNPSRQAFFWQHKHFQDRAIWLWKIIAERYKDNPWVAGYDPLNEPSDPSGTTLIHFYEQVVDGIRQIDPHHVIFLEGNRYSQDLSILGPPMDNVVYTLHDYPAPGFMDGGPYPGFSNGAYLDRAALKALFLDRCGYMLENQTPIWVGEFGPVYTGIPEVDAMRYQLLQDQLSIYEEAHASWSLWTYKDLGLQGLVNLQTNSKWMQLIKPVLEKKALLGVDAWGGSDRRIRHILEPIEQAFAEFYPQYRPFPFNSQWHINRAVRHILLAEPLVEDFYPLLADLNPDEIDTLMASFKYGSCRPKNTLCEIIQRFTCQE
jgi:endoglucanase